MLPNENRSFNVVSLFMIALVGILIPLNFYLGLPVLAIVLIVTEIMLITMFGLSRYRGLHRTGLHVYAGYSYLLVIFTYFYNDGSAGPALYFFLLTYQLLIAFTSSRLQWVWTILHFLLPVSLLAMEYVNPSIIYNGYDSRGARFADLMTSIPIIVICTFVAASYFRKRYECERAAAEEHAKHIEQQNERIRLQNELLTAANREKVELISILGHDLRNPMNAIIGTLVYVATKSGIQGFSESLRKEVNDLGIKVTLIEPGAVGTDMQPREGQEEQIEKLEMLKAEDIAVAIYYCLSTPKRCDVVEMQIRPHQQQI